MDRLRRMEILVCVAEQGASLAQLSFCRSIHQQ